MNKLIQFCLAIFFAGFAVNTHATLVQIETTEGVIDIELFDDETPETVANFLNYVDDNRYLETILHRSIAGFVVQGGGFKMEVTPSEEEGGVPFYDFQSIELFGSVQNEAKWSNVKGTIAMAKIAGDPDSATSQWFVNLVDNGFQTERDDNLDVENGGYTVFGKVTAQTMPVVEAISELYTLNIYEFGGVPLVDYNETDFDNDIYPSVDNFIKVLNVTKIESGVTASPMDYGIPEIPEEKDEAGAVGKFVWILLLISMLVRRRSTPVVQ